MSTFGGAAWGSYNVHNKRVRQTTILQGIGEGEAKRLSNGQWACLVCPSRPVMDTPEMLAVHRGGKKHLVHYETFQQVHNISTTSNDKKRRRDDEDEIESEKEKIQPNNQSYREPQVGPMMVPRNVKRQKIINNDGNTSNKAAENRSGFGQLPSSLHTKNNDNSTKTTSNVNNQL